MTLRAISTAFAGILFAAIASQAGAQTRTVQRLNALTLLTNATPKAVFVIPAPESSARDPFFPDSVRLKPGEPSAPQPVIKLIYNGLSGTADKPLAIVNGRTLAEGEETDIRAGNARVTVRCVSIQGETLVVEVNGRNMTLRLGEKK